jgi:hypothetical protein
MIERPGKKENRQADRKQGKSRTKGSQSLEGTVCSTEMIETVKAATNCTDLQLIEETLIDTEFDIDASIGMVLQLMDYQDVPERSQDNPEFEGIQAAESVSLKASACSKADKQNEVQAKMITKPASNDEGTSRSERVRKRLQEEKHISNRQRKEKVKRERKERRTEEQRQRARERHQPNTVEDNNVKGGDRLTADFGMLSI